MTGLVVFEAMTAMSLTSNLNVAFDLFSELTSSESRSKVNSDDGLNFVRWRKCWSRLMEIGGCERRPKIRSDPCPMSASGRAQSLLASPVMGRRICKVMDGNVAFDGLRSTNATVFALISMLRPPGDAEGTRRLMKTSLKRPG